MQKSVRVKSFELVAQDIAEVDPQLLHALTVGSNAGGGISYHKGFMVVWATCIPL